MTLHVGKFEEILVLEDNARGLERRRQAGVGEKDDNPPVKMRLHRINGTAAREAARATYRSDASRRDPHRRFRALARLLEHAKTQNSRSVLVGGTAYGESDMCLAMLGDLELPFVVEVRPGRTVTPEERNGTRVRARDMLREPPWEEVEATMPDGKTTKYGATRLGPIVLPVGTGELFAAQTGGLDGIHRGTIIGMSSVVLPIADLVQLIAHARWIGPTLRGRNRKRRGADGIRPSGAASAITARANITLARRQDARAQASAGEARPEAGPSTKKSLRKAAKTLNVVELFAGAGGMGLGFLLGGGRQGAFRIIHSAEANPIYVHTLRSNHRSFDQTVARRRSRRTPEEIAPVDLREPKAMKEAIGVSKDAGGAHIVIGGPPCQGFSSANRNSWHRTNPHNELVDVFVRCVEKLHPLAFLMENVQGILWTRDAKHDLAIVDVIEDRLKAAGYTLFPKLLDAAWYGVPQHRTRYFLMGLHRDLGYGPEDFGDQGPFPHPSHGGCRQPLVTVKDAIRDLPRITNGHFVERTEYTEPSREALERNAFLRYVREGCDAGAVFDHVTSKHADYVIERYKRIPPGGNWESILDILGNYADASRTHSNIYRRLVWKEPSITIGHYRKSMLVHPSQTRGLSLREASRLQSFPDWFRFAGTPDGSPGGLVHKQQQLANDVCPLVTKAIAEYMLRL